MERKPRRETAPWHRRVAPQRGRKEYNLTVAAARGTHAKIRHEESHNGREAVLLCHHPHLLRQRRPAPGHRLLHAARGRPGALPSRGRLRRQVPDRHGRARREGRRGRRRARHDPAGVVRLAGPALPGPLERARGLQRRLHPHHRAPPAPRGPVPVGPHAGERLPLQGLLRRLVLRAGGDLLHRDPGREGRRGARHQGRAPLPRLRPPARARPGGVLLLQALRLPGPPPGALRRAPRLRAAGLPHERGPLLRGGRPHGHLGLPHDLRLGHQGAL